MKPLLTARRRVLQPALSPAGSVLSSSGLRSGLSRSIAASCVLSSRLSSAAGIEFERMAAWSLNVRCTYSALTEGPVL